MWADVDGNSITERPLRDGVPTLVEKPTSYPIKPPTEGWTDGFTLSLYRSFTLSPLVYLFALQFLHLVLVHVEGGND